MSSGQREQYPTRGVDNQPQNWSLTTTSTSADQEIGSRTPAAGKKFCIQAIFIEVYLSTISDTAALLGTLTVRWGTAAILGPIQASNTSSGALFGVIIPIPGEYVVIGDGSTKLNAICTPATTTSTVWKVTPIGYERD